MLQIYDEAKIFMRRAGNNNQWTGAYPEQALLEKDITDDVSYICTDHEEILGTFFFQIGNEPTYERIYNGSWLNEDPYGFIHRIAVSTQAKGIATQCIQWALNQCGNLRIDTHADNHPMRNLLKKLDFSECGIIYLPDGAPRIAFQKLK